MKKLLVTFYFVLFISFFSFGRDKIISKILNFSEQYYKNVACGKIILKHKYLYYEELDTFSINYNCIFKKTEDKFLGAKIWLANIDFSSTVIYFNKHLTIYNNYESNKVDRVESPEYTPGIHGVLQEIPYFKSSVLINEFKAYNILNKAHMENDIVLNGVPYYKISYTDKEIYKECLISKLDFSIWQITFINSADKSYGLKYSTYEIITINTNSDECEEDKLYLFDSMLNNLSNIDFTTDKQEDKNDIFNNIFQLNFMALDSNIISLSDFKGKVILLDYWYMACAPCRKASPHIQSFTEEYRPDDFVVFGINVCDNNFESLKKYLKSNSINYTILFDYNGTDKKLPESLHPAFLIFDKNGFLVYYDIGYTKAKMKKISNIIEINL